MLITSIRDYVQLKERANLQDIARYFRLPESAVEQMLSFWVKKGVLKLITFSEQNDCDSVKCSDCSSCSFDSKVIYVTVSTSI